MGQSRVSNDERLVNVHYSTICKSELRRQDRRVAKCLDNIFFKTKKLQMKTLLGKCWLALKKHKTKGKVTTAGQLKQPGAINNLCNLDEG